MNRKNKSTLKNAATELLKKHYGEKWLTFTDERQKFLISEKVSLIKKHNKKVDRKTNKQKLKSYCYSNLSQKQEALDSIENDYPKKQRGEKAA